LNGHGVKIAILDSGAPDHTDIKKIAECVDVSGSEGDKVDRIGHSTMVGGVIGSKNAKAITGVAPGSNLYFIKVTGRDGECQYNSLVTGILWSIVKKVDIILMCLGSEFDYPVLHDAIRKAYDQNICIFAAQGDPNVTEYPAGYPEVLSIGSISIRESQPSSYKFVSGDKYVQIVLPDEHFYTTYMSNQFVKVSGSSLHAALGAGLAALLIEKIRMGKEQTDVSPNTIYSELSNLYYVPPKI
jgi:subtilisin family serine protease